ncbi:unnamed protein product [Prorocentrum cordatum]|uniref:Uncharacterized protein n=1 Tax=Prorocentrum cordatum TaxID=2364126 RepID=A0ABN9SKB2_9DINO|nr:unnamed protein product [Polarella glacialis]
MIKLAALEDAGSDVFSFVYPSDDPRPLPAVFTMVAQMGHVVMPIDVELFRTMQVGIFMRVQRYFEFREKMDEVAVAQFTAWATELEAAFGCEARLLRLLVLRLRSQLASFLSEQHCLHARVRQWLFLTGAHFSREAAALEARYGRKASRLRWLMTQRPRPASATHSCAAPPLQQRARHSVGGGGTPSGHPDQEFSFAGCARARSHLRAFGGQGVVQLAAIRRESMIERAALEDAGVGDFSFVYPPDDLRPLPAAAFTMVAQMGHVMMPIGVELSRMMQVGIFMRAQRYFEFREKMDEVAVAQFTAWATELEAAFGCEARLLRLLFLRLRSQLASFLSGQHCLCARVRPGLFLTSAQFSREAAALEARYGRKASRLRWLMTQRPQPASVAHSCAAPPLPQRARHSVGGGGTPSGHPDQEFSLAGCARARSHPRALGGQDVAQLAAIRRESMIERAALEDAGFGDFSFVYPPDDPRPLPAAAFTVVAQMGHVMMPIGVELFREMQGGDVYRCNRKMCHQFVTPQHNHPVFKAGWGNASAPLSDKAVVRMCAAWGLSQAKCHQVTGHSSKLIENTYLRLDEARMKYVLKKERTIRFGPVEEWNDIEADEVDLGKEDDWRKTDKQKPVQWEQWGGIVERGPGPIRKRDWKPTTRKHLENTNVVLHTDGARAYKMRIPGVIHDNVAHCKKKVVFKGKTVWVKPKYSEINKHILPDGQHLFVKTGTQIIDRFWSHLRAHLGKRAHKVNNGSMCRRIRSAQWTYWEEGQDLWVRTGEMLKTPY